MGRALKWTSEQKLPPVLSVLRGEGSVAEIGRRHQVSDVTLAKWVRFGPHGTPRDAHTPPVGGLD